MGRLKNIVQSAVAGNKTSLTIIVEMFGPVIKSESTIDGKLNEDLMQQMILNILGEFPKFRGADMCNPTKL